MKIFLIIFFTFLLFNITTAQKINGQWRGYFNSKGDIVLSGGDNTEYVLEIEVYGTKVTGFSYSYFNDRKYYVICSLQGTYNKSTKTMSVTETGKIKGSTPEGWSDCLQTHVLTYENKDGEEELKGNWKTAPGQTGNCGMGNTTLTRRTLSKNLASFNKPKIVLPIKGNSTKSKFPDLSDRNKKVTPQPPIVKNTSITKSPKVTTTPKNKKDTSSKTALFVHAMPEKIKENIKKQPENIPVFNDTHFEKRSSDILKTIEIEGNTFKVDLYDNGVVDGDSISVFYNGSLILSHKMLSEKPITLTLNAITEKNVNELIMYADNLGLYPPNTALMVVTDGDNRYEVRISSDLKKSGTIRFIHKSKKEK